MEKLTTTLILLTFLCSTHNIHASGLEDSTQLSSLNATADVSEKDEIDFLSQTSVRPTRRQRNDRQKDSEARKEHERKLREEADKRRQEYAKEKAEEKDQLDRIFGEQTELNNETLEKYLNEGAVTYTGQTHQPSGVNLLDRSIKAKNLNINPREFYGKDTLVAVFPNSERIKNFPIVYRTSRNTTLVEQNGAKGCTAAASMMVAAEKIGEDAYKILKHEWSGRGLSKSEIVIPKDLEIAGIEPLVTNFTCRLSGPADVQECQVKVKAQLESHGLAASSFGGHEIILVEVSDDLQYAVIRDPFAAMELVVDFKKFIRGKVISSGKSDSRSLSVHFEFYQSKS